MYPVGAIYISAVNTSPSTLFGGTWEQIKKGYLKAGESYTTKSDGDDSTSGSTTLTAAQSGVPAHNHGIGTLKIQDGGSHSHNITITASLWQQINGYGSISPSNTDAANRANLGNISIQNSGTHTHTITGATANNTAANASQGHTHSINLNYVQVYMWRRTA